MQPGATSCWGCCCGRQLLGLLLRRDQMVLLITSRTEGAARPQVVCGRVEGGGAAERQPSCRLEQGVLGYIHTATHRQYVKSPCPKQGGCAAAALTSAPPSCLCGALRCGGGGSSILAVPHPVGVVTPPGVAVLWGARRWQLRTAQVG